MSIAAANSTDVGALTHEVDRWAIATLRQAAADPVRSTNRGHPGLPLDPAPAAWVLWSRHLRHTPSHPNWPDRDRFVLSADHGTALLYALLNAFGYDVSLLESSPFREIGSNVPGHRKDGHTIGVGTIMAPLGQGLATGVGMALAERMLAARCNVGRHCVVNHRTWVLVGNGDFAEGIDHEATSLAGRLSLARLTVIFDDGDGDPICGDDVMRRFAANGWQAISVDDHTDVAAIDDALSRAEANDTAPSLVRLRAPEGGTSPGLEDKSVDHDSSLLGARTIETNRERIHVSDVLRSVTASLAVQGAAARTEWLQSHGTWSAENPQLAANFMLDRIPPPADPALVLDLVASRRGGKTATRTASDTALRELAPRYRALVCGSVDAAGSTNDAMVDHDVTSGDYSGRTVHFGIHQYAMAAALNGIALHGGLRPFGSAPLMFADHLQPALRLSARMRQPMIYVFTDDSMRFGTEDPDHQTVDYVESLRAIPGLTVLRPADTSETVVAWRIAIDNISGPTALVLTRRRLPVLGGERIDDIRDMGCRVVHGAERPDVVLVASGSEVALAIKAAELLSSRGVLAGVISAMWRNKLDTAVARGHLMLPDAPVVWLEADMPAGRHTLAGDRDQVVSSSRLGDSGPGELVLTHRGLDAIAVANAAFTALGRAVSWA